eukprot:111159-Prorocentrum_minimum.AAC.2
METSSDALSSFRTVLDGVNLSHKKALRDLENALHVHRNVRVSLDKTKRSLARRRSSKLSDGTDSSVSSYSSNDDDASIKANYERRKSSSLKKRWVPFHLTVPICKLHQRGLEHYRGSPVYIGTCRLFQTSEIRVVLGVSGANLLVYVLSV